MNREEIEKYLAQQFGQPSVSPDQMQAAQGQASSANNRADIGSIVSTLAASAGAVPATGYWDNIRQQGSKPLADLQAKAKGDETRKLQMAQYLQGRFDKSDGLARDDKLRSENLAREDMLRSEAAKARAADIARAERNRAEDIGYKKERDQAGDALEREKMENVKQKALAVNSSTQKKAVEEQTRVNNLKSNIVRLKELVTKGGTYDVMGSHNAQMEQLINDLAVDYAKLVDPESVARESEVENAKKMLISPSLFMRNSTAQDILDSFNQQIGTRINSRREAQGMGALQFAGSGGGDEGFVKVREKSTGIVRKIPKNRAMNVLADERFEPADADKLDEISRTAGK